MTYPWVPAAAQYGPRKGPVKAFTIHLAEGGGTVGFLSRPNARGVSVHYVVEYTGRIVQMVKESDATGSINPNDLRTTDDAKTYGATVRKAVMQEWDHDPNSAVISVEVEGFAATGPNSAQHGSLKTLVADVRSRYPSMGLLGHRDFADYKQCPGQLVHWDDLGGHGPALEDDVIPAPITDETPKEVRIPAGANVFDVDGKTVLRKSPGSTVWRPSPYEQGNKRAIFSPDPPIVLLALAPEDIRDVQSGDCADDVAAQRERDRVASLAAIEGVFA